jgi:cation-transporting ATPase 13A1
MLSLAVNLSLVALVKKRIYCTEPFRVPLAGKVETACFDKTGTLTSDSMEVDGVHGLPDYPPPDPPATSSKKGKKSKEKEEVEDVASTSVLQPLPFMSTAVMAACSGLTVVEGEVVGDPLEKAALQAVQWHMISPDILVNKYGKGADRLQVLRRYPFVSELQRMATLVKHVGPGTGYQQPEQKTAELNRVLALVKGSCEVLRPRLKKVPDDFAIVQEDLTKCGLRVLCLAAKEVPEKLAKTDPEDVNRQDLESDLEFCGMLVLKNSIKLGTVSTVKQLRRAPT